MFVGKLIVETITPKTQYLALSLHTATLIQRLIINAKFVNQLKEPQNHFSLLENPI